MTRLMIDKILPGEIAHFYEPKAGNTIFSTANRFWGACGHVEFSFTIPVSFEQRMKSFTRLMRRLTRTDKSNAVFNAARDGIVILYQGLVYFYDLKTEKLKETSKLLQCRNVLHGGICVIDEGIYFGEYGSNPTRAKVPVWGSVDDGRSWFLAYEFPEQSIRHIHGIYADPYSTSLWVPTGDFKGECYLCEVPNGNWSKLVCHGDGMQQWRSVSLLFEPDKIVWGMDSQLEISCAVVFDRKTKQITIAQSFPGPVWYKKRFLDGSAILQTSVEIGPGSLSDDVQIFYSDNLSEWSPIGQFKKDSLPKQYFKFGVVAFADGKQNSDDFVLFGEAIKGLDGKIAKAHIR